MALYGTKYIMSFNNNLNELYEVYFDYINYTGFSTPLVGDDDCVTIRAQDGNEDKTFPIIGQECLINIFVDQNSTLSIDDFIALEANNIRITVYMDKDYVNFVFQGFVAIDKMSQPFADPPYAISLRALDGLGLLKGVDLVDLNNQKFFGNYSVIQWIVQILYKTNQTMPIRVYFDWMNTNFNVSQGAFGQTYLSSATFSNSDSFNPNLNDPSIDINALTADDCYTALEKIIRCFRCKLFQQAGAWHIVNLYTYANASGYSYTEYQMDTPFQGIVTVFPASRGINTTYNATIGKKELIFPIYGDQILMTNQPLKWVQLTYNYDQSQNKILNQDFSEGIRNTSYDSTISSLFIDPSIIPASNFGIKGYDIYGWTHLNGTITNSVIPNPLPVTSTNARAYIASITNSLGYEVVRFAVVEGSELSTPFPKNQPTYIQSSTFLIDQSDALVITFDIRMKNSLSGKVNYSLGWVLLTGTDGSHWALSGGEGPGVLDPESNRATWFQVDANFKNSFGNTPAIAYAGGSGNYNNWANASSGSYKPSIAPVPGSVSLYLLNYAGTDEAWFKNISIQITPYLQGSYARLVSDFNYITSPFELSIRQSQDDIVEISDSPKRYFKGALIDRNGNVLPPGLQGSTGGWFLNGSIMQSLYRFTGIMDILLYNNKFRPYAEIQGTFKGLTYINNTDISQRLPNGFLNTYYFTDANFPTKRFMCTSYEKHLATGEWAGVFCEVTQDVNDNGFTVPVGYPLFNYTFGS